MLSSAPRKSHNTPTPWPLVVLIAILAIILASIIIGSFVESAIDDLSKLIHAF
jgi:hypothetical protein